MGPLENTGSIQTGGGEGLALQGGNAGGLSLSAGRGLRTSGAIQTSGGAGRSGGGAAGPLSIQAQGLLLNGGSQTGIGGACSDPGCVAGSGTAVSIYAYGADLRSSATIDLSGGAGEGTGGPAGGLTLGTDDAEGWNLMIPSGSLYVSGNFTARGGLGNSGGGGGNITLRQRSSTASGQQVVLFGYQALSANGGAAPQGNAGAGGNIALVNGNSIFRMPTTVFSGGAVVNQARLNARGGTGATAGAGGSVFASTQTRLSTSNPLEFVRNSGRVDVSAGASTTTGPCVPRGGGSVEFIGPPSLENAGELFVNGGACTAGIGASGNGGWVNFISDLGTVSNSGAMHLNGGESTGAAGGGGALEVQGLTVRNTGALEARGGNATQGGGGGGSVKLTSTGNVSTNTGAVSVAGGTGTPAGTAGSFLLDGLTQP